MTFSILSITGSTELLVIAFFARMHVALITSTNSAFYLSKDAGRGFVVGRVRCLFQYKDVFVLWFNRTNNTFKQWLILEVGAQQLKGIFVKHLVISGPWAILTLIYTIIEDNGIIYINTVGSTQHLSK